MRFYCIKYRVPYWEGTNKDYVLADDEEYVLSHWRFLDKQQHRYWKSPLYTDKADVESITPISPDLAGHTSAAKWAEYLGTIALEDLQGPITKPLVRYRYRIQRWALFLGGFLLGFLLALWVFYSDPLRFVY